MDTNTMVYSEVRPGGGVATVRVGEPIDRVVFRLEHGPRSVTLTVRFEDDGTPCPEVSGDVIVSVSLGVDLLALYRWRGLDALLDAMAVELA